MADLVIIQGSLNPKSKTAIVVSETEKVLKEKGIDYEVLDLRKFKLEFCDGRDLSEYNEDIQEIYKKIEASKVFIIATPVYQYSISGVIKNLLDIVADAMENKFMGVIANAGGQLSYLAPAEMMKLLSYEVGVMTVQPTVFSWSGDFDEQGRIKNEKVLHKINDMVESLVRFIK